MQAVENRYNFVLYFDVKNGNPNGDPDAGNLPRIDPETGQGLVTDACLKRKVRNYVDLVKDNQSPFEIHDRQGSFKSENHKRAHVALKNEKLYVSVPPDLMDELSNYEQYPEGVGFENGLIYLRLDVDLDKTKKAVNKLGGLSDASIAKLKELFVDSSEIMANKWMCKNFFDVRTFGAVLSTGDKTCGHVTGPVQIRFATSVDTILGLEVSMSRTAAVRVDKPDDKGLGARKSIVPYGLYRCHGQIDASLAQKSGFGEEDLNLFWEALVNMFEHDHSAARGEMATQKLVVFKHDSKLGNAHSRTLFNLVTTERATDPNTPPRSIEDYNIHVDKENVPQGVTIQELV